LRRRETDEQPSSAPKTLWATVLVNLLNPNPYLGWALILGPQAMDAWQVHPSHSVALVAAFYGTMIIGLGLFIVTAGTVRFLSRERQRQLTLVSGLVLLGLALFLLGLGLNYWL
jgi:threonine/homoserine/homoserine lactone efflux protein